MTGKMWFVNAHLGVNFEMVNSFLTEPSELCEKQRRSRQRGKRFSVPVLG